jgi:hypothetical protein
MKTFAIACSAVFLLSLSALALDAGIELNLLRQQQQQNQQSYDSGAVIYAGSDNRELRRANDRQELKDTLAPYFRYKDEFERLYPYKMPEEPDYSSNPDDEDITSAQYVDYKSRLARWKLRMKARQDAKPASTPIRPIVTKPPMTDTDKETAFNAEVEKSRQKTISYFPDAGQSNNPIHTKAAEMWKDLEKQNSPLLHESDAPFIVYSMVAAQMGIKPVK